MTFEPFILAVLVGASFAGGIANGLVGFGAMVSMVIWLLVIDPLLAVPLTSVCALVAQMLSLAEVWHARNWRRIGLLTLCGIAAVPVGAWLLTGVNPQLFKALVGSALALYSAWRLFSRQEAAPRQPSAASTATIGLLAGFSGGFTGVLTPILTLWSSRQGWSKDEQRATYQPVTLAIVAAMLVSYAAQGLVTGEVVWLSFYCAPAMLIGTLLGTLIYRRISDMQFETIILVIVLLSGLNLALRALWG